MSYKEIEKLHSPLRPDEGLVPEIQNTVPIEEYRNLLAKNKELADMVAKPVMTKEEVEKELEKFEDKIYTYFCSKADEDWLIENRRALASKLIGRE